MNEKIYDIINWRFIQHLGDIRNFCDHKKQREPLKEEIEELIIEMFYEQAGIREYDA